MWSALWLCWQALEEWPMSLEKEKRMQRVLEALGMLFSAE